MGKQEAKVIGAVVGIVLLIIIIMMLLPFGDTVDPYPNNTTNPGGTPQGTWGTGDKPGGENPGQGEPNEPGETSNKIGFPITDSFTVSPSKPMIKLTNPKSNQVNFVFTITDVENPEKKLEVSTPVAPGGSTSVNMYDFYNQEVGRHNVIIGISTFSSTGEQCNGANIKAVINVVP